MKLVIFGLTISSSWGNGHATLWRGLCRALIARGHEVVFFERDASYYAARRDFPELPGGRLVLYESWPHVQGCARAAVAGADATIISSYCPDALEAGALLRAGRGLRVFYDLDTPVTLARRRAGAPVGYVGREGLRGFDLVLSFTGGAALGALRREFGAGNVAPFYGWVDSELHAPGSAQARYRSDLSYLGAYAADRQEQLERFFVAPARQRPDARFVLAGAQYPADFPWAPNIYFVRHLPPAEHPAFFSSSRLTLNVTSQAMARLGYCPSGRLFEAAACGVPILSDVWPGLEQFFAPGREILLAENGADVHEALCLSDGHLRAVAEAARARVLAEHTAERRAVELECLFEEALAHPAAV